MLGTVHWSRWAAATAVTGLVAAGVVNVVPAHAAPAAPTSIFVVNTGDDVDDGACDATHCSLREAIGAANATTDLDRITFTVGTVTPSSSLPNISAPVEIDGGTAADCAGVPGVVLDGIAAGATVEGLTLTGGGTSIRGLVLSRWSRAGIAIRSSNNVVQCSYAGTNLTATATAANQRGIDIQSGGSSNLIGGLGAGEGNVLSGNQFQGLAIAGSPAAGNVVQGNLIGTDRTGTLDLGNGSAGGIALGGSGNLVGGSDPAARNVISGNNQQGIQTPIGSSNNTIEGNYIGVDITGNVALGNATDGVSTNGAAGAGAAGHVIRDNVISGNGNSGVQLSGPFATGITVEDNLIGVGADGTTALRNGPLGVPASGWGVIVTGPDNIVRHNTIANNGTGVTVGSSPSSTNDGVTVSENAIDAQVGLGIDLANNGVTANDPGDTDSGANGLQNFPVITAASATAADGTLDSAPSATYRVEVFASAACDSSGFGEGARFVGAADVTTDPGGQVSFSVPVTGVADGEAVTATATAPDGSTSELSQCEAAVVEPDPFGRVRIEKQTDPAGATGFAFTGPGGATPAADGSLTPGGEAVAFTTNDGGIPHLEVLNVATGTTTAIANTNGAGNAAWSPDGARLAYQVNSDLRVYDVATGVVTVLPPGTTPGVRSITWSPDGAWIAYDSADDIWAARADGSAPPVQLTTDPATDSNPAWGPDGRIAFRSARSAERVWVGTFDDGTASLVGLIGLASSTAIPSQQREMDWSPDGSMIVAAAAVNAAADDDLYRLAADGTGTVQQLTTAAGDNAFPTYSPDGTRIAYSSAGVGGGDLSVIPADGTGSPQVLYSGSGDDVLPDWGQSAFFGSATYTLDDDETVGGLVPAGQSVTFTEQPTEGWGLGSLECGGHPNALIDGPAVTFTPAAGDDIVCTFTNVELPTVLPRGGIVTEGDSGSTTLEVLVELSAPSSQTVTVDWETVDTLAQPQVGVDYQAASGTVTFLPGETSATVPVTVYGDTLDEDTLYGAEWGAVRFHSPTNAVFGSGFFAQYGLALIADDDPPPVIKPIGGSVVEGDTGTTTMNVRIDLSVPSGRTVSVNWATVDTHAQPQAGVDYQPASGTLTFLPGETSKTVPVTVHGDLVDEPGQAYGAEWGSVKLSSPTNATFGSGTFSKVAFALIFDDD